MNKRIIISITVAAGFFASPRSFSEDFSIDDVVKIRSAYEASFPRFYMEGSYKITEQRYFVASLDAPSKRISQGEMSGLISGYYVNGIYCFNYTLRVGQVVLTNNVFTENGETFYRLESDGNTRKLKEWSLPFFPLELLQIPQGAWKTDSRKMYSDLWIEHAQQVKELHREGDFCRFQIQRPKALLEYDVFVDGPRKGAIQRIARRQKAFCDEEDITELKEYSYDEGSTWPVARRVQIRDFEPRVKEDLSIELYTSKEVILEITNVDTNVSSADIKSLCEQLISRSP